MIKKNVFLRQIRRGLGDCFVGVTFAMESSTPLVALRGVLRLLNLQDDMSKRISLVNQVWMTLLYFIFRIASIPALYLMHAQQT